MHSGAGRDFPDLRVHGGDLGSGVRYVLSTNEAGASQGPFASGNLADHVGDDAVAVATNRAALARALPAGRGLAFIGAAHGADVAWVDGPGTYRGVDALVTESTGLGLVALGADCAVVALSAPRPGSSPLIGVAHCGWRGLVADVLGAVVEVMRRAGAERVDAVLGPAICGSCYRVDAERIRRIRHACTPRVSAAAIGPDSRAVRPGALLDHGLDVRAGARERLRELAVRVGHEFGCTHQDRRWYSHRRATGENGPSAQTGRHAMAIVITGSEERG